MHPAVKDRFISFNQQFEGRLSTMYLDTHEPPLVTIGVGNLIDPISEALKLPFLWKSSKRPATADEIASEWNHVKSLVNLAHNAASIWATVTGLFLDDAAIDALIAERLAEDETLLKWNRAYAQFDTWPADAQLALLSMAWAMGPGFRFPLFEQACTKRDFTGAAGQCRMADEHNPGLKPRNRANFQLLMNAAQVEKKALTISTLYYPLAA